MPWGRHSFQTLYSSCILLHACNHQHSSVWSLCNSRAAAVPRYREARCYFFRFPFGTRTSGLLPSASASCFFSSSSLATSASISAFSALLAFSCRTWLPWGRLGVRAEARERGKGLRWGSFYALTCLATCSVSSWISWGSPGATTGPEAGAGTGAEAGGVGLACGRTERGGVGSRSRAIHPCTPCMLGRGHSSTRELPDVLQ